MNVEGGIEKEL